MKKKKESIMGYIIVEPSICDATIHMYDDYDEAVAEYKSRVNYMKDNDFNGDIYFTTITKKYES